MALPGTIQSASPGLLGFDTDVVVSVSTAQQFSQQGYRFCARYLSHNTQQGSNDLSTIEATNLLDAGLAIIAVQHVPQPGWSPTSALGTTLWHQCSQQRAYDRASCRNESLVRSGRHKNRDFLPGCNRLLQGMVQCG